DECATGAGSARRKLWAVTAVDEHESDGTVPWRTSRQTVELLQSRRLRLRGRDELDLRERSKTRVLPVLVLRGRKPQLGETRERRLPEQTDPPAAAVEQLEVRAQAAGKVRHLAAPCRAGGSKFA